MSECIFCRIGRGELPCKMIYEDEDVIAFHDISPKAPVHFLIIPKRHITSLAHVTAQDEALLSKMFCLVPRLAAENGCTNGYRLVVNTGADGGQEVPHLHLHVLGGGPVSFGLP